jgi:PAS domain S-box-containing protein
MFYQKRLRNEPVPNNYESKAVTKDGKIVEVEIVVVFIEYEGQIAEHVVMRDITERKII